ncbi:MAG: glycosyltransferase family 39 protein, partial [Candidatus Aenigmatarchaeota archaeon]
MKGIKIFLIFLFLIGFLLRFLPVRTDSSFHYWDEAVYLQHAEILGGYREDNYNEFDFRPPLLPVLITLGYKIYHSVITAHFIVAFIASLGVISTFFLAKALFNNEKIAMLAAIIFFLNPLHIQLAHDILVDSILPTFWVLAVLFIFLAIKKEKIIYYSFGGILFSLSILLKFTSLSLFFSVIIIFIIFNFKLKRNLIKIIEDKKILLLFLSSFLILLPYLIFAQIKFGFFLKPFILANMIVNWDTPTPWYFFFTNFTEIFPLIFLVGIIFNI